MAKGFRVIANRGSSGGISNYVATAREVAGQAGGALPLVFARIDPEHEKPRVEGKLHLHRQYLGAGLPVPTLHAIVSARGITRMDDYPGFAGSADGVVKIQVNSNPDIIGAQVSSGFCARELLSPLQAVDARA